MSLKDAVKKGNIPSSDYETAGLEVTYKNGGGTDVVIPSEIDGKKVIGIAAAAFTTNGVTPTNINNTKKVSVSYLYNIDNKKEVTLLNYQPQNIGLGITSVVIPNTVMSIGESAFTDNQLTEVTIPSSVTSIKDRAFENNRLTSVVIPDSVTTIGKFAFYYNRLSSLTIPSSVTSIGDSAFNGNQLTEVTIPSTVVSIGYRAFYKNNLTELVIPNSVTSIGDDAFAENYDITIINNSSLENSSEVWENIISDSISIDGNVITYLS